MTAAVGKPPSRSASIWPTQVVHQSITSSRQQGTIRGRMQGLVDDRYRAVGFLGAGGMADVYLVHDDLLERDVALKVLRRPYADDEDFVMRFKDRKSTRLNSSHANISYAVFCLKK